MRIEGREPGVGRVRVLRKANVVGGVVLLLIGLVVISTVSYGSYPWFSDALAGLGTTAAIVLAIRAFQPSISIYDDQVKVRRFADSGTPKKLSESRGSAGGIRWSQGRPQGRCCGL